MNGSVELWRLGELTAEGWEAEDKRKEVDANLRLLATVVRDSNDAITVQDLDGKILVWNRGAERMYGFSEAEALVRIVLKYRVPDIPLDVNLMIPQDVESELRKQNTHSPCKNIKSARSQCSHDHCGCVWPYCSPNSID